ncbi:hypothetical protein BCR35DRAFT_306382 [Leucosporidium creatinivorum]|uniref:Palmitoyltransferase n=1 Tax=Leucosporidium creatinivorum TaxID=106004 RepID=A0A1Y2ETV2_9BASI|nr:hypothetical protein BCR35DRAFT_306382 [Leucosporidium creatinivorum]
MARVQEEVGEALVGAAEATRAVSTSLPPRRRSPRYLRVNVVLGKVILALLVLLAWKGFELVVIQTGSYIALVQQRPLLARVYQAQFIVWYLWLFYCFFSVYLVPRPTPSKPPPDVVSRSVIFECTPDGEPVRCFEDDCAGAWKSLRTRHCRDCGVCQPGFDHHCPFMDACVSANTFKAFACFLFTTLPLMGFAEIPLMPIQLQAVREVVRVTWSTEAMREDWWSRWWSWAGGPVWRYGAALLLGYRRYHQRDNASSSLAIDALSSSPSSPYASLATPHLTPLLLVVSGGFVWWVAVAMTTTIINNARRGLSTVQVERIRRWKLLSREARSTSLSPIPAPAYDPRIRLWVPLPREEYPDGGAVVHVDPTEPLFDLGARQNWRLLMGEHVWQWFVPWIKTQIDDFQLNPEVVRKLQDEARKRST